MDISNANWISQSQDKLVQNQCLPGLLETGFVPHSDNALSLVRALGQEHINVPVRWIARGLGPLWGGEHIISNGRGLGTKHSSWAVPQEPNTAALCRAGV